jgi:hypothetical protein
MTAAWESDGRPWRGFWQIVSGLAFSPGARLSVAVRSPDFLDVFVIGVEHQIWTAAWQPSFSDWFHGWSNIGNFTVLVPPRKNYKFSLPKVHICEIRSRYNDTLYVSVAVQVGDRKASTSRYLGDQKPSWLPLGDSVTIEVGEDETAVMAYDLVNSGHTSRPQMENTMKSLVEKLADAAQSSDMVWLKVAGWVLKNVLSWIFADCDGAVLAGVQRFDGSDLEQKLSSGQKIAGNDRQFTPYERRIRIVAVAMRCPIGL